MISISSRLCAREISTLPNLFSQGKCSKTVFTQISFFGEGCIAQVQRSSLAYFTHLQKSVSQSLVERRVIHPRTTLTSTLDKRLFSTRKMEFEPPCHPIPLMKGLKQVVHLRKTSPQKATPLLQKKIPLPQNLTRKRAIYPISTLTSTLDKRLFSTRKMGFESPSNLTPLMKNLKQVVRLRRTSSKEAIPSLQKMFPEDPFRWGQVGLILFLTFCVLAGVEASAEENAKEESLLSDPVIASFACRSFSITAGDISKIKVEKLDGLSIWAKSYKLTHEETNQSIALRVLNPNQPAEEREKELFLIHWMSEIGIAPRVIEIDSSHGLISTVFIQSPEPKPWHMTNMTSNKIIQFATSLKLLHSQPLNIKNERFQELDNKVLQLAALHPQFQIFKTAIEKMQELDAIQHRHIPAKFCHNDVGHGGNTLWDGKKAWMIDWELAGNSNPYFDIASPMVLLFFNEENRDLFFRTYLGHTPSQREKDLLLINQQYAYLRYGATSLGICHEPSKTFTLSPEDINQIGAWSEILTGKVVLKREEMQTDFGRCKTGILLIHQALNNMKGEEFQAAISRLASNDKDY